MRTTYPWKVPPLPVLTPANRATYPQWHAYYEAVYHHRVTRPVDVNTFTWFYWTAPFEQLPTPRIQMRPHQAKVPSASIVTYPSLWMREKMIEYSTFPVPIKKALTLMPGDAFIGSKVTATNVSLSLMRLTSLYGFFVCRPSMTICEGPSPHTRVEVLHVLDDWRGTYSSWYWHVRGSGVFLQVGEFASSNEYKRVRHRDTLDLFKSSRFPTLQSYDDVDVVLPKWMRAQKIRVLHIDVAHSVPEIILMDPVGESSKRPSVSAVASVTVQHRDQLNHSPHSHVTPLLRHTIRMPQKHPLNIDSLIGTMHQYITTGDTRVIRKRRIVEGVPILSIVCRGTQAPVWTTPSSYELIQDVLRDASTLTHIKDGLQKHLRKDPTLLNRWVPVHIRRYGLQEQSSRFKSSIKHQFVDTVCTPLACAALCYRLDVCKLFIEHGASLSSRCPPHYRGENESDGFDVTDYLQRVLPKLYPATTVAQLWNSLGDGTAGQSRKQSRSCSRKQSRSRSRKRSRPRNRKCTRSASHNENTKRRRHHAHRRPTKAVR